MSNKFCPGYYRFRISLSHPDVFLVPFRFGVACYQFDKSFPRRLYVGAPTYSFTYENKQDGEKKQPKDANNMQYDYSGNSF